MRAAGLKKFLLFNKLIHQDGQFSEPGAGLGIWHFPKSNAQKKKLSLSTDTSLPSTYNFLSKRNVQIPHVPCNQNSTLLFILPQITLKPRDEHGSSQARQSNPSALITSHHSNHPGLELEGCCCHFLPCSNSFLFGLICVSQQGSK